MILPFDMILASVKKTLVRTLAESMRCLTLFIQKEPSRCFATLLKSHFSMGALL